MQHGHDIARIVVYVITFNLFLIIPSIFIVHFAGFFEEEVHGEGAEGLSSIPIRP